MIHQLGIDDPDLVTRSTGGSHGCSIFSGNMAALYTDLAVFSVKRMFSYSIKAAYAGAQEVRLKWSEQDNMDR